MRFPWLQFDRDAGERCAALASWLNEDEFRARGMVLAAWMWGCTLGPKDAPPDGICRAPNALARLAAEMRYRGEPARLSEAMEATGFLEILPDGIRIRGTSRYRRVWEKNQRRRPKMGQVPAESAVPVKNRAGPAPVPATTGAPDADADAEEAFRTSPAATSEGGAPEEAQRKAAAAEWQKPPPPDPEGAEYPEAFEAWEWMGIERAETGRPRELRQPRGFERWHHVAVREAGIAGLQRAYRRYIQDSDFAAKGWPTAVFMSLDVWSSRTFRAPPKRARS